MTALASPAPVTAPAGPDPVTALAGPAPVTAPARRRPVRLRDRLVTVLCLFAAVAAVMLALSRGNPRAAAVGAGVCLGYAVLHAVARRLEPTARLATGHEADDAERLAQFRATRTAGQTALLVAAVGVVLSVVAGWDTGLWVAGAAVLVVASFVVGLWWFGRGPR